MASMRDIKRRKGSIQSTQQITKAMKLVSTVKLQRSKQRAINSKAYFDYMYRTIQSILGKAGTINHSFVTGNDSDKKAVVVITGNRGLAGGYNSNMIKCVTRSDLFKKEDLVMYTIGKKGREAFKRYEYNLAEDYSDMIEAPDYVDAMKLCSTLLNSYRNGEIGEIWFAYTAFKSTVSHEPTMLKLLPVNQEDFRADDGAEEASKEAPMNFDMPEEEALDLIIPKYLTSIIYGGMIAAVASENGARMQAMDSATSNAEEMISKLTLQYNRARQGSITQELTEIIAGAQAIS